MAPGGARPKPRRLSRDPHPAGRGPARRLGVPAGRIRRSSRAAVGVGGSAREAARPKVPHPLSALPGADYQAGFRSCLHGVNQFLLRSEGASEASSFHLLQELARAAPRGSGSGCRTTDSGPLAPRPEPRGPLQKAGGSRPFTQRPRAPGAPSAQPPTEPGAAAQRRGPGEQRPSVPSRRQALWRPW
ncbi:hes family bHLH transcription factor 3 [Chelydra serpentina]|uniref:Hes family bHLH transcription factor 3 n=1 Tax=Chelydra serpentina TaxID=8475 RepID=A0A8T1SNP2_CHESE|nr:hes family bHLH transcription factor 3 [Chelydra serpentina]